VGNFVLLTGFGPFGGYSDNPTARLAREIHGYTLSDGGVVHGEVLPSSYARASRTAIELANELGAHVVLSTGYASRVPCIRVEARGYNERNSGYTDCDGCRCSGTPIDRCGADFYETNADNQAIVDAVSKVGVATELSHDAERFICNNLIYAVAREVREARLDATFAYIHTPTTQSCRDLVAGQPEKVVIPDEHLFRAVVTTLEIMCHMGTG
jgi:pyroglutamyl-peptidase